MTGTTATDTQVTTVVQQIDAQGPLVVDRITSQFADLACTPENARQLVDALHSGRTVTLTSNVNGQTKTATFTPPAANLGYGEAYIALALAAEALRTAGVTGCATPDQWKAVLLGGPLAAAGTTSTANTTSASASSSTQFPGILTLRSQGQGWGQIAHTTNVQLGQVVSQAHTSFSLDTSGATRLSPTGRTSAEMNQPQSTTGTSSESWRNGEHGKGKGKGKAKGHDKDHDGDRDDHNTTPSSSSVTPPSSSDSGR